MHRSALGDLLIDVDPDTHDRELEFWQQATGSTLRPLGGAGAHTRLKGPWSGVAFTVQRLEAGDSRVHLDVMTDDVAAESAGSRPSGRCGSGRWTAGRSCATRPASSSA